MADSEHDITARLRSSPTYQAALRGEWFAPGMPQTPGFRAEHLRAAARQDGILIPSGFAFDAKAGKFTDSNVDRWYSDPRVLGPIAVGATTGIGALAGPGGGAGASGASGALTNTAATAPSWATSAPGAIASQGVSAGIPLGGVTAAGAGAAGAAGASGAASGTLGKLANWLKDNGGDLAALGIPAAAMAFGGNGGGGGSGIPPEISKLLAQAEARTRRADPLHQAAVQMAFGALPGYGRQGINLPKVDLP